MEKEILQTVASYLLKGFKTPLPGLVTISRVNMPADLRTAKIFVSVLGSEEDRRLAIESLQERAFEIQRFIGDQLKTRYCPKITFFEDHTTEQVLKIEKILHDLEEERKEKKNSAE